MTDYNDGKWHGWNGGECPVHPKSQVDAVCTSIVPSGYGRATWKTAGEINWAAGIPSEVVAFRVVKEHREPREVYLNEWRQYNLLNGKVGEKNVWGECSPDDKGAVLFREVIE